jgi:hypothetical protein
MEPYLPQNDPNPEARRRALEERRKEYYFNYNYLPGYPFLDTCRNGRSSAFTTGPAGPFH